MQPNNNPTPDFQLPPTPGPVEPLPAGVVNPAAVPAGGPSAAVPSQPAAPEADILRQTIGRVQQILETSGNDPYNEVKAIERVKADYLRRRFGREIKVIDN
jgi:hypothetical protein